ncbi:MAG: hypothetical protein E5Y63_26055 [Mesorhizobium sp.]|nr:MAG: hypothetical protein EOR04_12435 [Mesorhizobium sp.]TIM27015.1 MAG: hypothetical protein E5Y63_26055 [Mesorhizobium sp.]
MFWSNQWPPRLAAVLGLLVAGTALAPSGHASAAAPQWLVRPMVFLHTTTIAVWIGERPFGSAGWPLPAQSAPPPDG